MSVVLYNTEYLQLKSTPANNGKDWIYAHRPNAKDVVVVLPHTEDEILFIIEKRPPIVAEGRGEYCIALPAGLVGDERIGETTIEAAKSELLEEAGLVSDEIEIVAQKVSSSSGSLSETCAIAIAKISDKKIVKTPVSDGGIIVDRIWVRKSEVREWLKKKETEGYVLTGHTLAALYYLFN